ncbi:hypothetical protein [Streptomyces sp. NBC_01236]|uniref:hypothetical protein n=1 Tax=Streptomyces sp. NBC_01236 TaxID=2903789 RepID=UPI002E0E6438|nr:hypothetical protein OG324_00565 [Streptomyces sp. NBC_01236]
MEIVDVLTELARSGQVGPVANGAAWDTVTEALGEPFEVVVGKRRSWPRLFTYGDLELSVCRCQKVVLICLQTWRDVIELPAALADRQTFPGHPKYADLIAALDRAGCAWRPYTPLTFDNQCAIEVTSSGVLFVFEIPEGEDPILNIAGPQAHHHDCPAATKTHATP